MRSEDLPRRSNDRDQGGEAEDDRCLLQLVAHTELIKDPSARELNRLP